MLVARLEVLGEIDERGAVRFTVDSASTVRGMNGEPVNVIVENFSRTGFLFVADVDFPAGTLVSIGLSGAGVREAKVVRREGREHGCEFLMPLPRRELDRAFKGQDLVLADLEAALERRFREVAAAEVRVEPRLELEPAPPSRLATLIAALRRLLKR